MPDLRLLKENTEFVNQQARKSLQDLNASPDPSSLYLLQLMSWGLQNLDWEGESRVHLEDQLGHLLRASPKQAMSWLFQDGEDLSLNPSQPQQAASDAVNHLESRLSAEDRFYPPPNADAMS